MKIVDFRRESRGSLVRLAATVLWEKACRPPQDIYWELPNEFADDVALRSEAFLTVATLPAMRLGEERIALDAEICPDLVEGLTTAMAWLARWNPRRRPLRIEAVQGCSHASRNGGRVAAALLSGGVDSLALLRSNALRYASNHPRRVKMCFVYRGVWGREPASERGDIASRLARARAALTAVVDDTGVTLVPIYTNLFDIADGDIRFWQYEFQGAALAAAAHLFADRINAMSIASTWDVRDLRPWGSHPLLDPNYGSHDLSIHHELSTWSRMDKTKLLAEWLPALDVLRVCNRQPEAETNCGKCEKCTRTMLSLLALDALERTKTFHEANVTPLHLHGNYVAFRHVEGDYREIAHLLGERGRKDLAIAIRRHIVISRAMRVQRRLYRWAHKTDHRYFRDALARLHRARRTRVADVGTAA